MDEPAHEAHDRRRAELGLSRLETWLRFLALGGNSGYERFCSYLDLGTPLPGIEPSVLEQVLDEAERD